METTPSQLRHSLTCDSPGVTQQRHHGEVEADIDSHTQHNTHNNVCRSSHCPVSVSACEENFFWQVCQSRDCITTVAR